MPLGPDLSRRIREAAPGDLIPASRVLGTFAPPLDMVAAAELSDRAALVVVRGAEEVHVAAPVLVVDGSVRRALPGDGAARALAQTIAERHAIDGFAVVAVDPGAAPSPEAAERPMLVDQTHESVIVGDASDPVVVKWAVRAEQTPAPTLVRHLAEAGFHAMPRPWGFVTWATPAGEPLLVASAMQYLPGATDGWTWAVDDAAGYAARGGDLGVACGPMADVGRLVADLHTATSTATGTITEPAARASEQDVRDWHRLARRTLDEALSVVDGPEGSRLAKRTSSMVASVDQLTRFVGTPTIPVHGDLHVGQVLRWAGGYAVGDFDGNPVLPVAERLRPQPVARDVAGMLQSVDHVGRVASRRVQGAVPDRVQQWIVSAQSRFLDAYRDRLQTNGRSTLFDERLLLPFQVEQECREFLYAVRHLPRWRYVPDQALQALFPATD